MCPALPDPEYYGSAAPPRPDRPTMDPALTTTLDRRRRGEVRDGSRVHPMFDRRRRSPAIPPRPWTRLPRSTSPSLPRPAAISRPRIPHRQSQQRGRTAPSPDPPDSSWCALRRRQRRFLSYSSPSRSPDPPHLAVLERPGFVRGCSHPPRHLPDQAAPSFTALLRQDSGGGLSPPLEHQAPHGAHSGKHTVQQTPVWTGGTIGAAIRAPRAPSGGERRPRALTRLHRLNRRYGTGDDHPDHHRSVDR